MIKTTQNTLISKFVGSIYDDLIKYYGLYGFIHLTRKKLFKKPVVINSEKQFWSSILKKDFKEGTNIDSKPFLNGQVLIFKDFYLSEWAPKLPGKVWTKEGTQLLSERDTMIQMVLYLNGNTPTTNQAQVDAFSKSAEFNRNMSIVFSPDGKRKSILGGLGSVRVNPSHNPPDFYMYMSLTTGDIWKIDYGIPLVVSKSVYAEYKRITSETYSGIWVENMEGYLILDSDLPLTELIKNAIGAEISNTLKEALIRSTFLPKCYVYIPSILNTKLLPNKYHPEATAWSLYRKKYPTSFIQRLDPNYSYTYSPFDPGNRDSIKYAVEFIKEYALADYGECLLTDFDGIEPKLDSVLNLKSNPMKNQFEKSKKTLIEISDWDKGALKM